MKNVPASKTCASLPAARCRARFSTMPIAAPTPSRPSAPIVADLEAIKLRQRVLVDCRQARHLRPRILGEQVAAADRAGADRPAAACSTATAKSSPRARRRPPASRSRSRPCRSARSRTSPPRSTKPFWFQLYVMRDRGFIRDIDPARAEREMQRAGAHRRSPGARPAPPRHARTA